MFFSALIHVLLLLALLTVLGYILGEYLSVIFSGKNPRYAAFLRPLENGLYKLFSVDEREEMTWKTYAWCVLLFNGLGIILLYLLQEIQGYLPFNPNDFGAVRWDTALNTAISFTTNTNWQSYAGEQTMSYLTQMLGMTVQNFLSAGTGITVAFAFIRGFLRQNTKYIGNFWVDLTRSIVYVLLPLAFIFAFVLISQGMIQNLMPNSTIQTLEGQAQIITQGPVASQEAIKIIGTNGGGFFNANASHPFENPTPFTDFLEILGLLLIPAAFPFAFGAMQDNRKQGWTLFSAMMILYVAGLSAAIWAELNGNPLLSGLGVEHGLSMEGKEVRFGPVSSVIYAHSTTCTSTGSVNAMHDSMMPLTGLILIFNMVVGEVIFGGVGVGLIGFLFFAILSMFLIGLMIGRSPEIFGKKLQPYEMILAVIAVVLPSIIQLILGSVAISTPDGISSLGNTGPHGISQILYAFASATGNNGSAFGGLNAGTVFYNLTTGIAMLTGRIIALLPALAVAGLLASKRSLPEAVRFPTTGFLFAVLLVFVVIIVGALTLFPFLSIGPILEHCMMVSGRTF